MSKINRGKQFEKVIQESFEKVPNTSIDRIPDQQSGYVGSRNICDFIVYKYPCQYYIECKTTYGNTFLISRLTQFSELIKKHHIKGVFPGVIVWWVDKDVTKFISTHYIQYLKDCGIKSVRFDNEGVGIITIQGKKKRVFFDYDMEKFMSGMEEYVL